MAIDLWEAVSCGDVKTVSSLLEKGANPNHSLYRTRYKIDDEWVGRRPPLHEACTNGKLQTVRLLVERGGADVNRGGGYYSRSPLHWACNAGYKDLVKYLIEEANCKCGVGEYLYL